MGDNPIVRIAFFITLVVFVITALLLILFVLAIVRTLLRRRLRRLIARDSEHDLVGRSAMVVRTVRQRRSGQIQVKYQDNILNFKAVSDRRLNANTPVRIIAVTTEGFRVSPMEEPEGRSSPYQADAPSTLEKTVMQDNHPGPDSGSDKE